VRAKSSFTASGMYSSSGTVTTHPIHSALPGSKHGNVRHSLSHSTCSEPALPCGGAQPCPAAVAGEGLLHDARNLMGALGLYCDLLAMPGVLKPEHNHYPEELRLLGNRSQALIENLMQSVFAQVQTEDGCKSAIAESTADVKPVGLRGIVERCSGLLSRVAGGRPIEVLYGVAASVPVRVDEEAVERILVNLVRNASAALGSSCAGAELSVATNCGFGSVREIFSDQVRDPAPGAIRIGVGSLVNRVGDPKPWPFRRVRLTVEDSGCGMAPEQVERLVCGGRAPSRGNHGIGFRVVRELVGASGGDLRVMSQPGIGTRVQIEWPVAVLSESDLAESAGAAGDASIADRAARERLNLC
jgi:signal transduction histidine kinase